MKIKIELEIDLGDMFINRNTQEERDWLFQKVLKPETLYLHSNEIGDGIGKIIDVIVLTN